MRRLALLFSIAAAQAAGPADAHGWKKMGVGFALNKEYREAESAFHKACALDPREPDACYFWARALYALDRFEESLAALSKARPGLREVQARAQALDGLGRSAEAERLYREVAGAYRPRAEDDPRLHFGVFLLRQGRAAEALPFLDEFIQSHSQVARGHLERGRVLMQLERLPEAADELEQAVSLDAGNEQARLLLGRVHSRLGRGR